MTLPVSHAIGKQLVRYGRTGAVTPPAPPPAPAARFPGDPRQKTTNSLYFGTAYGTNGSVTPQETAMGTSVPIRRRFYTTIAQATAPSGALFAAAQEDHAANRLPWLSFKVPTADWGLAGTGSYDSLFDSMITTLESYSKPTWVILNHEPENDGGSPTNWRAMQNRFRSRLNAYKNSHGGVLSRVSFGSCLMVWTWNPQSGRDPESWWAGSGVHDWISVDHYTEPTAQIIRSEWISMESWTAAKSQPFAVAEWGLRPQDTRIAAQMQQFYDRATNGTHDCVAMSYFDSDANSTGTSWFLNDTNGGKSKFYALATDPRTVRLSDLGF